MINLLDKELIGHIKVKNFESISEENCFEILENLDQCKKMVEAGVDINELINLDLGMLKQIFYFADDLVCLARAAAAGQADRIR